MYKFVRWFSVSSLIISLLAFLEPLRGALPPEITSATFPQSFIIVGPVTNSEILVNSSICDGAGNTYVTGSYMGKATFGNFVLNSSGGFGNDDVYLVKYDPAGNVLWARSAGGSGKDYGQVVALDGAGGVFLSGTSDSSPFSIGGTNITNYGKSLFVARYDGNGNLLWVQRGGAWLKSGVSLVSAKMTINGLARDASGNIIVGGSFNGNPSIGGSLTAPQGTSSIILSNKNVAFPSSYEDLFLAKFAPNGNLLWATNHGSTNTEFASSIAVDSTGAIYAAGGYENNTALGANVYTNTTSGILLTKFSSAGAVVWSSNLSDAPASNPGYGWAVAVDASDRVNFSFQANASPFRFGGNSITNTAQSFSFGNVFMGILAQFDTTGNLLWLKRSPFNGGGPGPAGNSSTLALDKLNNVYLGSPTALLTNNGAYVGASVLGVYKYDSTGAPIWTNIIPNTSITMGVPSVSVDDSYVTHVTTTMTGGEGSSLTLGWRNIFPFTAFGYNQLLFTIAPSFVSVAPQILQQPTNMVFQPPQGFSNTVVVRGWPAPTYAWYRTGGKTPFSTNFFFSVSPSSFSDRTSYYAVLSNPSGTVTSAVVNADAKLAFLSIPPSNIYVLNGSTLALSGSATGTTAIAYQWQFNTTNIANATGPTLALSNMTTNQAGNYTLVISNGAGSITSAPPSVVTLLPFGALDPSWTNTYVNTLGGIVALTRAPDGSFYVANGQNAARYTPTGTFDPGFINVNSYYYRWSLGASDFKGPTVIQREADGKVLLAGTFKTYYPTPVTVTNVLRMARLNPDGTVDGTFNVGAGPLNTVDGDSYTQVESVIRLANGQYLVAGTFNRFNGQLRTNIVRLNNDGSVDLTFPAHATKYQTGSLSFGSIHGIQLQADGKILLGGEFEFIDGQANHCLARLNADGTLDTGFVQSTLPAPPFARVKSMIALADGKILAAGSWSSPTNKGVVRFNGDGSKDSTWVGSLPGETYTVLLLPGNKLVMGGNEFVKRTSYDGVNDTNFNPGTFFTGQQTYAIVQEPSGNLMVGGSPYGMRRLLLEPGPVSLPMISNNSTMSFMNGQFQLAACGGVDGQTVIIQGSADLVNWANLSTNVLVGGCFNYTDAQAPPAPHKYYRISTP